MCRKQDDGKSTIDMGNRIDQAKKPSFKKKPLPHKGVKFRH